MKDVESMYMDGTYLQENPEWDRNDASWKAGCVSAILSDNHVYPQSICDVGCGSGDVLANLRESFPGAALTGFDISPQASQFWSRHSGIVFHRGRFHEVNDAVHDVLLMLDVIEHVRDPFSFLEDSRKFASHVVLHIPLDLSVSTVIRGTPLLQARRKVGHIHYYTKDLALEMLSDTGYVVTDWRYTDPLTTLATHRRLKTRLAALPRRLAYAVNKDFGVRLLGGETLLVLAQPRV